jgi:hypothetical protein
MMLFLLFLIPVVLAAIIINFSRNGQAILLPLSSFFLGMLFFLPSFLLANLFSGLFEQSYTAAGFFFHAFFREHAIILTLCLGWIVLLRNFILLKPRESILYQVMAFFGGYYTLVNLHEYLARITHLDAYALFLLPLLNLAAVIVCALLLTQVVRHFGLARMGALAGLVALPFVMTVVTVLFQRNHQMFAVIGALLAAGGAGVMFFWRKHEVE